MTNPHKGRTGIERIVRATGYSIEGLATAYRGESAFRQETWLAVLMMPLSFWLGGNWVGGALLALRGRRLQVYGLAALLSGGLAIQSGAQVTGLVIVVAGS